MNFFQEALVLGVKIRETKTSFGFWKADKLPWRLAVSISTRSAACPEESSTFGVKNIHGTFWQKNRTHGIDGKTRENRENKHLTACLVEEATWPASEVFVKPSDERLKIT
jgi:hypothetical protein